MIQFVFRLNTHVKPLIWIESVIEKHAHSRVEIMVKAKSQFKRRSTANNVEIMIPVPNDSDSPKFKTTIGLSQYSVKCLLSFSVLQVTVNMCRSRMLSAGTSSHFLVGRNIS